MSRPNEFSKDTLLSAWIRQGHKCGLCGTIIYDLGESGRASHTYGEIAHGHHIRSINNQGLSHVGNCIILCQSCHYTAHAGGNYRWVDKKASEKDYPYFIDNKMWGNR